MFNEIENREYVQYDHNEEKLSFNHSENGDFLEFSIKFTYKILPIFHKVIQKLKQFINNIDDFEKLFKLLYGY